MRVIEYKTDREGLSIAKHDCSEFPLGLMDGGEIKDEKKFSEMLSDFTKKNQITYAKVSISEEKSYLFQTDIPSRNVAEITQNVEFKLEENVPLPTGDGIFYFDILPASVTGDSLKATVSVVSRAYVEKMVSFLRQAGIIPVAFEVVPKSIARSVVLSKSDETLLVIHVMNHKTGIYIVSGGVVCFSSTIATKGFELENLKREIIRVNQYWSDRPETHSTISRVLLVGHGIEKSKKTIESAFAQTKLAVSVANVWSNIFDNHGHVPPKSEINPLEYVVAVGLALPL